MSPETATPLRARSLRRHATTGGAFVLAVAGVATYLAVSPRLTLLNSGIRLAYPALAAFAIVACGLGVAVMAFLRAHWIARIALLCAGALLVLGGLQRLTFRIEADADGLRVRMSAFRAALAWRDITRAETTGEALMLATQDGTRAAVSLAALTPQQRVGLTRTISRRVSEAAGIRPSVPSAR